MQADRRFPGWVYRDGHEPDPRFTLANERTFLAWIGVGLAVIAGGVALRSVALPTVRGFQVAASVLLLVLGLVIPLAAWRHWGVVERALRLDRPLPGSAGGVLLAVGLTAAAALLLVGLLLR